MLSINKEILDMVKIHYSYFVISLSVFSIAITSFQAFAVEEIWEDYDTMGEMVKDIKNGGKDDNNVDYNKFRSSMVYKNATEDVRNCIDLANKVGDELGDYEIVHCYENTNYFKEKYVDDVQNTESQQVKDNQKRPQMGSLSNTSKQDQEQKQPKAQQSISKYITGNRLLNELLKTGKFTEDEAKEFVSQNMPNGINITSPTDSSMTNETKSSRTNEQMGQRVNQNQTLSQIMANANQTKNSDSNSTDKCDPSYPDICITTYSSKLICSDIPFRNFKVLSPDPHSFDSDDDGIGCEE